MKNTAINTLKYTGVVTLSQCIGSKKLQIAKIHNKGGQPLFDFFSDCLLGDFDIASKNRPAKIMLLKKSIDTDTSSGTSTIKYTSASGFIYLLSKPEKVYEAGAGKVRYSFIVSRAQLESTTFDSIGLYTSAVDSSAAGEFAAIAEVSDAAATLQLASTDSSLLVDWELIISNKEGAL